MQLEITDILLALYPDENGCAFKVYVREDGDVSLGLGCRRDAYLSNDVCSVIFGRICRSADDNNVLLDDARVRLRAFFDSDIAYKICREQLMEIPACPRCGGSVFETKYPTLSYDFAYKVAGSTTHDPNDGIYNARGVNQDLIDGTKDMQAEGMEGYYLQGIGHGSNWGHKHCATCDSGDISSWCEQRCYVK
jgi:hypothetical protein